MHARDFLQSARAENVEFHNLLADQIEAREANSVGSGCHPAIAGFRILGGFGLQGVYFLGGASNL